MYRSAFFTTVLLGFYLAALGASPGPTLPEKIVPITQIAYGQAYYLEQAGLWKAETLKNNASPEAWFNFFRAARYANMLEPSSLKPFDLPAIVRSLPGSLENTFEGQFIQYMAAEADPGRYAFLLKAYQLAPDRQECYHDMINYHLINGHPSELAFFSKKIFEAGDFPAALLAWNYNLLASVEPDGILLTHGDNETYPAWILQWVKGIRPDVMVLNANLLMIDAYRERVLRELGVDPGTFDPGTDYLSRYKNLVGLLIDQAQRPVYLTVAMPAEIRNAFDDNLFITGLALKYAPQSFDNLAFLKNNFENKFLKDYLRVDFNPDSVSSIMASMNLSYLPALLLLHQHYGSSGETAKAKDLATVLRQIAREGGRAAEIEAYLEANDDPLLPVASVISVRALDKGLKKIQDNLYAFDTEVTNAQYEAFLMDLVKNRALDLLETCLVPRTNWRAMLPEKFKDLPDSELFKHANPDEPTAPVVNASYQAAKIYCDWITKVYNASDEKKKAFRKVRFRLPTEAEWELAARGGIQASAYPWGGPDYKNAKGCVLANYDMASEAPAKGCEQAQSTDSQDGGYFAVKADSYFPNGFGLYNTSGNVAEMIQEPGVTKGGSWAEAPSFGQISARNTYSAPAPFIGFRVFLEVVEY